MWSVAIPYLGCFGSAVKGSEDIGYRPLQLPLYLLHAQAGIRFGLSVHPTPGHALF